MDRGQPNRKSPPRRGPEPTPPRSRQPLPPWLRVRAAGRKKTGPQLALTVLYHMGTGLPWAWRTGPGTDAERAHLRSMLATLPSGSLLVADAGFTGYDLLRTLLEQMGLMSVEPLVAEGHDPLQLSVATALRVVRHSMRTPRPWRCRGDLRMLLGKALKDGYCRRGSKKARDWPHKKRESPPGVPKIRKATNAESTRAQRIYETKQAA